ncbi:O-antigen ligase family protein [Polaribacter sp. Z022]|uniref:O-antigen ligase family protein n=1 Tax=Polaribacter sp. Z022 TaxID=2927125 RepID=UPI00201FE635|nr:O-antigen ligase family protein [Polaribacter sp. Z022]MCL7753198.1 O-antigen ligase family protein [Polaribacter sp. Z022]
MIEKILNNRFLIIGIHIALGFLVTVLPIAKIYSLLFFIVGVLIIYKSKNKNEEAFYLASYLVGTEVFMRMSNAAILYETGKYGLILFILMGLFLGPVRQKSTVSFLVYILFLLIGIVFTQVPMGESIRKAIVFNLSGPLTLGVFAFYCYNRTISITQLKELLFFCLLPMFSMISYIYFRTPNLEELVFNAQSNFDTSGGFGPNQVATMLGFGVFILGVFLFVRVKISVYIFLDGIFLAYFIYRGLLTFSRGGMITAAIGFASFAFFMFLFNRVTLVKISKYIFITIILFFGIWLYTSNVTGGMIDNRYANKNSSGVAKKDISAGRTKIIDSQLNSFYESPIFGIGVGNGKYKRLESGKKITAASHNEVSRLIEEHGLLGVISLLILLIMPIRNIYFGNNYQRAFLSAFYIFWFLTINHSAMRIAFPAFVYGLSLIRIVPDEE